MSGEAPSGVPESVAKAPTVREAVDHVPPPIDTASADTGRPAGRMGPTAPLISASDEVRNAHDADPPPSPRARNEDTPADSRDTDTSSGHQEPVGDKPVEDMRVPSPPEVDATLDVGEARDAANKIIDARVAKIEAKEKRGERLSNTEVDILIIDTVRKQGFKEDDYPLPITGGVEVTGKGTIVKIEKQLPPYDPNTNVKPTTYVCVDASGATVRLTADDLARGFVSRFQADLVEGLDSNQKAILEWYSGGEKGPPPTKAVEKEKNPMTQANRLIQQRIDELIEGKKLDDLTKQQREEVFHLQTALSFDGDELGALIKMKALLKIVDHKTDTGGDTQEINAAIKALDDKAKDSEANLMKLSGLTKGELDKIRTSDFDELFKDKKLMEKFIKIPDMAQKLYGREVNDEEVEALATKHLTAEQKAEAEKLGKGGLIAAILLVLLAAIPVAAGTVAVGATSGLMSIAKGVQQ